MTNWRVPEELLQRDLSDGIALYGEPLFVSFVAEALRLHPIEPPLGFLARLPVELRKREVQFATLDEAGRIEKPAFIKPASEKTFAAQIYANGAALPTLDWLPDDTPVLISEPVQWEVEFRCFVCDGEVQTLSPYWRGAQTAESEDGWWPMSDEENQNAQDFARLVLSQNSLSVCVLDVGIIAERGWAVVEANPAYGSGLYGCDPTLVLKTVSRAFVN